MKLKFLTTARVTGLLYLGLAITGMAAFLFARQKLFVEGDALATTVNFVEQESLARFGVAAELALVAFQALAALWFYKLFRKVDSFAAISLAAFGLINAVAILLSNAFWLSAVIMASKISVLPPTLEQANNLMLVFGLHETTWIVSNLFFGLWLIPMGYLAKLSHMPKFLAWILIGGGLGYVLASFLEVTTPSILSSTIELLTTPATIGEFWMIGYLLVKKVKV